MSGRARILLIASLALNLFLAGALGGLLWLDGRHGKGSHGRGGGRGFSAAAEQLSPDKREAFRALLHREAEEARPRVQVIRAARRQAAAAMAAEPYNPEAVRTALARASAEELALRADFERAVIEFAATLPPNERAAVGQALRKGPRGGKHRKPERRG